MWPLPPTYLCEPEPGPQLDSSLASDVLMQPALVAVLLPLHTPCPDPALHWCGSLRSCHPLVFAVGIKRLPFPRPRCWTLPCVLFPHCPCQEGARKLPFTEGAWYARPLLADAWYGWGLGMGKEGLFP